MNKIGLVGAIYTLILVELLVALLFVVCLMTDVKVRIDKFKSYVCQYALFFCRHAYNFSIQHQHRYINWICYFCLLTHNHAPDYCER